MVASPPWPPGVQRTAERAGFRLGHPRTPSTCARTPVCCVIPIFQMLLSSLLYACLTDLCLIVVLVCCVACALCLGFFQVRDRRPCVHPAEQRPRVSRGNAQADRSKPLSVVHGSRQHQVCVVALYFLTSVVLDSACADHLHDCTSDAKSTPLPPTQKLVLIGLAWPPAAHRAPFSRWA